MGRTCITAGVLILLFVAYQLWGTGIRERQAQDRLTKQFNEKLAHTSSGDGSTVGSSTSTTSTSSGGGSSTTETLPITPAAAEAAPPEGDPVGKVEINKIGLSAIITEGVSDGDLHNGPGHYPATPLPGQQGNAAIAGHRTTYGAPFANIDELAPTDPITVTTVQGVFTYKVMTCGDWVTARAADPANKPLPANVHCDDPNSGHIIVSPNAVQVLDQVAGKNFLTLTACHPKYSASERIIVFAKLEGNPKPAAPRVEGAAPPELNGLSGKAAPKLPPILYGLLCAAIWIAAWRVGKLWRKWPAYFIGLPFFLVALFFFFENFSRLLPSNY